MNKVALLPLLLFVSWWLTTSATAGLDTSVYIRQVRKIELDSKSFCTSAALAYETSFASCQGRGAAEIAKLTFFGETAGTFRLPPGVNDPLVLSLDGRNGRLYLLEGTTGDVIVIQEEKPTARIIHRTEAWRIGLQNPCGLTVDPASGNLFILESEPLQLVRLELKQNPGGVETAAYRQETISLADIGPVEPAALRGPAFNPNNGHLYLLDSRSRKLHELTASGQLVITRDLSSYELTDPQSLLFAPSGDRTDDPELTSLYLIDLNPAGSETSQVQIFEFSLDQPVTFSSLVQTMGSRQASLIQTIETFRFLPPSPDPAGLAFDSVSGNLIIGDSEVDEMSIFTGDNVFISTLEGTLVRTGSTMKFSKEPTGVAFNPVTGHLFISSDDAGRVFEIDSGLDGQYFTADDVLSSFDTHVFGSYDAEGVAFDGHTGALFIADGVNAEVYRVDPGLNGVFDGLPPTGDDLVTQFDTAALGVIDPEGIEFRADVGCLYLVGDDAKQVAVTTVDGHLLQMIDISAANAKMPAGLALGPGSRDPGSLSLYISDRGVDNNADPQENDGRIYEMSLPPLTPGNQPPMVEAGPDQTILLLPSATLQGTIWDDGVPDPPVVVTAWSQVSGPGLVTFSDPGALNTTGSFSEGGSYVLRLSADDGELLASDEVTIVVTAAGTEVTEVRIDKSSDDAEQRPAGNVSLTSSDLEMVDDGGIQVVGLRFNNLQLPPAAQIISAYLQFQADEATSVPTSLIIQAQATDNAATFTSTSFGISSRPKTVAEVQWEPPVWGTKGEAGPNQRTPNLASLLQEIVNRPGWSKGNSLALIVTGTGKRVAVAYDGNPGGPPLLRVLYSSDSADITPPQITAFDVPSSSTLLTVPILSFSAIDNVAVNGYLVTESKKAPLADDPLWSVSVPTSYTVADAGAHTLYGWARDGAGNVSASLSDSVTVTLADTQPPQVTAFDVPLNSTSLTVPILAFSATDNVAVNGFLVTEAKKVPLANDLLWSASAPTSYTVAGAGTHTLYGWARDAAGNVSASLSAEVSVTLPDAGGTKEINIRVTASADDAEQKPAGNISLNNRVLELGSGIQVGLRFNGVTIPPGATILDAYLQFQVGKTSAEVTALTIQGQSSDNAATFTNTKQGISNRPTTEAVVSWSPAAWGIVGEEGPAQRTPDISPLIQEIVSRSGWTDNNSLAIIITGFGRRVAKSYDGSSAGAPLLHVQYSVGTSP